MSDITDSSAEERIQPYLKKSVDLTSLSSVIGTRSAEASLRMPDPKETSHGEREVWKQRVWKFFMTAMGSDAAPEVQSASSLPLTPAAFEHIFSQDDTFLNYPFVLERVPDTGEDAQYHSLYYVINQALAKSEADQSVSAVLKDNLWKLIQLTRERVRPGKKKIPVGEIYEKVFPAFLQALGLPPSEATQAERELDRIKTAMPAEGRVFSLGEQTLYRFAISAALNKRVPKRAQSLSQMKRAADALQQILDASTQNHGTGTGKEALNRSFSTTDSLINLERLSGLMPRYKGSRPIKESCRERLEDALQELRAFIGEVQSEREYILIHSGPLPEGMTLTRGKTVQSDTPLKDALSMVTQFEEKVVKASSAWRLAKLEIDDAYDPSQHDDILNGLTWPLLNEDEKCLMVPILVFVDSQVLDSEKFAAYSNILLNGDPVYMFILRPFAGSRREDAEVILRKGHTDWGFLSMAYRKAYVLQSSISQPSHLLSGLLSISDSLNPAVAFIAVPSWGTPLEQSQVQLKAAIESRISPLFNYDPDAGMSMAKRFNVSHNPQPMRKWPRHTIQYVDSQGHEKDLVTAFTYADYAATVDIFRHHFMVLPPEAWDDSQVSVEEYISNTKDLPVNAIPYTWVVDSNSVLHRAVISRALVMACRDRILAWRTIQEQAGIFNDYVTAAVEEVQAGYKKEIQRLEAQQTQERQANGTNSETVVYNILNSLLGYKTKSSPVRHEQAAQPTVAAEARDDSAAPKEPDTSPAPSEPHIDSDLCSSCNECINLNSSLFQYNDNKQAYIANPEAGNFLQLVKAAEKCPSECIHPGQPRPGDSSVTEALLKRAEKFNGSLS